MDVNVNPAYPLFPVFAFVGFVLVLIPLPWHFQASNVGACAYIFWASVACLFQFANSVIWRHNALNPVPVWCDISSKFCLGAGVGIAAAGLCTSRRLYVIFAIGRVVATKQDKRRAVIIDSSIAFGIPVLVMILHYVVQGHRFDILEDVGCYPVIYNTLPAYFLVFMWPTVLGCISFIFSFLTIRAYHKHRSEFSRLLADYSTMNRGRYIRLTMLSISEMSCTVPISVYSTYIANKGVSLQPWTFWADVHYNFSRVEQIAAVEWMSNPNYRVSVELTRWLFPASALLFFALFGCGSDARKHYRAAFLRVGRLFRYKPASQVPVHAQREHVVSTKSSTHTLSHFLCRQQAGFKKKISVGSLSIYASCSHVKHDDTLVPSATKRFDVDVEKLAGFSLPSLASPDSPLDCQPSPVIVRCAEDEDLNERRDAVAAFPSVAVNTQHNRTVPVPAYHGPFSLPSVRPIAPRRAPQPVRSLDNIRISVHTQYSIAL